MPASGCFILRRTKAPAPKHCLVSWHLHTLFTLGSGVQQHVQNRLLSVGTTVTANYWKSICPRGIDCPGGIPEERLWRYAAALAPLAGSLASREARGAHTAAFKALGRLLPPLQRSARLLSGLNAMSTTEVSYGRLCDIVCARPNSSC